MYKSVFVVDIMREIVERVSAKITPSIKYIDSMIEGVHFMHGHPIEIAQTLKDKSDTNEFKFKKYPCICLLQDFEELKGVEDGIDSEVKLHVLICKGTMPDYKAYQRYDKNFKPFLYPVYDEFIDQIYKSSKKILIKSGDMIKHKKTDRLFWGVEAPQGNKAGIFLDHLDIIEIKDLTLKIKTNFC